MVEANGSKPTREEAVVAVRKMQQDVEREIRRLDILAPSVDLLTPIPEVVRILEPMSRRLRRRLNRTPHPSRVRRQK